jgi:hypothetical protein
MEEIDFEKLKALIKEKTDIEFITGVKQPMKVRIRDKHYRVTGIGKRDLLEYFDSVPDQGQQKATPVPGV